MKTKRTGFTMIELLVVIVIVSVLATLGVTQYTRVIEHSRQAEAVTILDQIRGAQLRYILDNPTSSTAFTQNWNDLDIDQPIGKYFTYDIASAISAATAAIATRNTTNNPGYRNYLIVIDGSGAFTAVKASSGLTPPNP